MFKRNKESDADYFYLRGGGFISIDPSSYIGDGVIMGTTVGIVVGIGAAVVGAAVVGAAVESRSGAVEKKQQKYIFFSGFR